MIPPQSFCSCLAGLFSIAATISAPPAAPPGVSETAEEVRVSTDALEAAVRKKGYVSGVAAQSFLDRKTGFRDPGFGLVIVDWLMEPGSDVAYRKELQGDLAYDFNNSYHGKIPKRSIEGPQICTQAREIPVSVIRGKDFVAVKASFRYTTAAPGKKTGSLWEQTLVFPAGKRYFFAADRITTVNASDALFLRLDLPGHIKHTQGDTFSEVYLSYAGRIPASAFRQDFAPDDKLLFQRGKSVAPKRFIRAYRLRDSSTGKDGPWLAGMTLDPAGVHEAWCHQRGYVCFIQEIGGRAVKAGDVLGAAYIVGYFDSIEEMEKTYDEHAGATRLEATEASWQLQPGKSP